MPTRPIDVLIEKFEIIESTFTSDQLETIIELSMAWALCTPAEIEAVANLRALGKPYAAIKHMQQEAH